MINNEVSAYNCKSILVLRFFWSSDRTSGSLLKNLIFLIKKIIEVILILNKFNEIDENFHGMEFGCHTKFLFLTNFEYIINELFWYVFICDNPQIDFLR